MMNNDTSTVIRDAQATGPWYVSVSKWTERVSRQIRPKRLECLRLVKARACRGEVAEFFTNEVVRDF